MSKYINDITLKAHALRYVRTEPHFHYGDWYNMCISGTEIDDIIDTCPVEDVVPVVRCRECVHWGGVTYGFICRKFSGIDHKICMGADHYCSYREKGKKR